MHTHALPRFIRLALLPVALAAGCSSPAGTAGSGAGHSPLIMDQLHNGGTTGFLFLPPMVPRPGKIGDIVPDLPVTVRVDEIRQDGSTIRSLATFTSDSGPRRERVRYHLENGKPDPDDLDGDNDPTGYYLARWKTADENLSLAALYRVRVLVPAASGKLRELGFADVDVVRNERQFRSVDTQNFAPLIDGETLRIKFRVDRPAVDADGDGIFDWKDNCPNTANQDQTDSLGSGVGDACRCDKVVCTAADACHGKGVCNGKTGTCDSPALPDGTACPLVNATAACSAGTCKLVECAKGFGDCNGKPEDGCETAVDTIKDCGSCGVACAEGPGGAAFCKEGRCGLSCKPGLADCDGKAETGCEADVTADVANCGGCGLRCEAGYTCEKGACTRQACGPGTVDCNGSAVDGCEVKPDSDVNNCGACGNVCNPPRATAACAGGLCGIAACDKGFADCNKFSIDGCEIDLLSNVAHCGACLNKCAPPNAVPSCVDGACGLAACNRGFADCNKFSIDGCEINLLTNPAHCGACLNKCITANGTPSCVAGACAIAACDKGFADCDGIAGNGCEQNLNTSTTSCGACGAVCVAGPNAVPVCKSGRCDIACTTRNHADCDGNALTGCEVDTLTDNGNCGACGVVCGQGTACVGGACTPVGCGPRVADCDGLPGNGCETEITSDPDNCGGCNIRCLTPHAFPTCTSGSCGFSVCHNGYADCDGAPQNGCEVAVGSDESNCGGCGVVCGAGSVCDAGVCTVQVLSLSKGPTAAHACAVLAGGVVKCWGENGEGRLGDGTVVDRYAPVTVFGLAPAASVATGGYATCARLQDGTVYCWGRGSFGMLGNGDTVSSLTPVQVLTGPGAALAQVVEVAGGDAHFCARLQDGTVRCWGWNGQGEIGDGTTTNRSYATATSNLSSAISITSGYNHSCAALGDGSASCWGHGPSLFIPGAALFQTTPLAVPGIGGAVEVAGGFAFNCARLLDGTVRCWGSNDFGQLGDGTTTNRSSPVSFTDELGAVVGNVKELAVSFERTCARLGDGTVRCAGAVPGDGTFGTAVGSVKVLESAGGPVLKGVAGLGMCGVGSFVARPAASLGWGSISGDGTNSNRLTPVPIAF